ncbi:MAG: UxaA family hydrolase [Verrucomicrobiia bacterium]
MQTLMNMDKPTYLKLHPNDNVVVLLRQVKAGDRIEIGSRRIVIRAALPMGHKIAVRPIKPGEQIVKYGVSIGTATAPIDIGEHVHVHNVRSNYMACRGKEKAACNAP